MIDTVSDGGNNRQGILSDAQAGCACVDNNNMIDVEGSKMKADATESE